jgi:hypothetical protein
LRKGINIKAFTIFLSWLMILAHSIVPHNHIEHDIIGYAGNLQSCVHHHDESSPSGILHDQCGDINSCHISSFLFPHFNQDNLIIQSARDIRISSVLLTGQILFDTDQDFIINDFTGSVSLRAPPAA